MHGVSGLNHRLQCDRMIPAFQSPLLGIDNDGNTVVANHASSVIRREFPDGQLSTVCIHAKHGFDHVFSSVWLNPCQQGVKCPVGVPQAEN